ncbi:unnamed protein product [Soboliphyme baturini]|uniref:MOSC domain-containing protein n=1 Tax=Soboliphyme baturini TaxID=241478 RepID=A0A183I9G4_9BILA|nr:unnamed protein product [Soboliphyme baturini]
MTAVDSGAKASEWLNAVLDSSGLSFASRAQYLLVNSSTIRHFMSVLALDGVWCSESELTVRFRPNLVISGVPPFQEETWQRIKIDHVFFRCVGTCSRCRVICVDPETGNMDNRLLTALRKVHDYKLTFGIYLAAETSIDQLKISVGDAVEVIDYKQLRH